MSVSNEEILLNEIADLISIWEAHFDSRYRLPTSYVIYIIEALTAEYAEQYLDVTYDSAFVKDLGQKTLLLIHKVILKTSEPKIDFTYIFNEIRNYIKAYLLNRFNGQILVRDNRHSHHYLDLKDSKNENLVLFTQSTNKTEFEAWMIIPNQKEVNSSDSS